MARVFYGKVKLLLDDLLKQHVLGIVVAYVLVIEFQKRDLPHGLILLILRESDKIREPEEVDSIVLWKYLFQMRFHACILLFVNL